MIENNICVNSVLKKKAEEIVEQIAKKHLQIETIETRGNDRLDFSAQSVWSLKKALLEAFDAGFNFR